VVPRPAWAAGIVVGLATLGLLAYVVGVTELTDTLATLSPAEAIALVGLGLAPIAIWGLALGVILAAMGEPTGAGRAALLFAVSLFFNGVTPFGQTGGAPLTGGVIAHAVRAPYERALAAIGSLSAINTLVALGLWLLGAVYLGVGRGVTDARRATVVAVLTVLGTVAIGLLAWRGRAWLADRVAVVLASGLGALARLVPRVSAPSAAAVADRVAGFVAAIERLAGDRRRLAVVIVLGLAGQLAVVCLLYAVLAVFAEPSFAVALFVVPAARAGAVVPTPGGIGSTEALLTSLLVTAAGVAPAVAGAAAIAYRATAFWLPSLFGGVAAAGLLLARR